jgi:hypothetical protein
VRVQDGEVADVAGFYEDDEPQEKIEAAFERGAKKLTARPAKNAPVAFSRNERLVLRGTDVVSGTVAAVVTRTRR